MRIPLGRLRRGWLSRRGKTLNLFVTAGFNVDGLSLSLGEQLRTEAFVSFGNAGSNGSGAGASNIDINGNGIIDTDEKSVRTVPARVSAALPKLQVRNDVVTLTNAFTNGLATAPVSADPIGAGVTLNGTQSYNLTGNVGGAGIVSNKAGLKSARLPVTVARGPASPVTGIVPTATRDCCVGFEASAISSVDVGPSLSMLPTASAMSMLSGGSTNSRTGWTQTKKSAMGQ